MNTHWAQDAIFYHIYPLGLCGAPPRNDFSSPAEPRLAQLHSWLDHIQGLGANALYLGPLFESTSHGYDTADYYWVDRRLGTNETLAALADDLHRRGMRLILDGVFNHVGRDFWAFRDLRQNLQASPYRGWFAGLDFAGRSPKGDSFSYEGWAGHYGLVKLNLEEPAVRHHLLEAVRQWIEADHIDGLRLDAADCISLDFHRELAAFTRRLKPDFWLTGEIIHGDYREWANPETLDSVTNYECYKGLYSSLNDRNYFEIAYALNRQFGPQGLYRGLPLYNFADNHDVDRVASVLKDPAQLCLLYALLFTMPGVPSLYYGSEWGLPGRRTPTSDAALRPALALEPARRAAPHPALPEAIARLARLRHASPVLRYGDYQQLHVSPEQLAFARTFSGETLVVALNASGAPAAIDLPVPGSAEGCLVDLLNPGEKIPYTGGQASAVAIPPRWALVLAVTCSQ